MMAFISDGSIQLLVGPASFSSTEQMKVRSSTRATSVGSEAQWNELGFLVSSSRVNVPVATSASVSSVHSSSEPVHHRTSRGWVSSAISLTQLRIPSCVVGAVPRSWVVSAVMPRSLSSVRGAAVSVLAAPAGTSVTAVSFELSDGLRGSAAGQGWGKGTPNLTGFPSRDGAPRDWIDQPAMDVTSLTILAARAGPQRSLTCTFPPVTGPTSTYARGCVRTDFGTGAPSR